jgi:galactose-1-phosphate uridylyltransferase
MSHPLNHIPVPKHFRVGIREKVFARLLAQALVKAEEVAGEPLRTVDVEEVAHKLRKELEKRDFFNIS